MPAPPDITTRDQERTRKVSDAAAGLQLIHDTLRDVASALSDVDGQEVALKAAYEQGKRIDALLSVVAATELQRGIAIQEAIRNERWPADTEGLLERLDDSPSEYQDGENL